MEFKIEKVTVNAPARKLKGTWTIEPEYGMTDQELDNWRMYHLARRDYFNLVSEIPEYTFTEKDFAFYMEQNWGIKINAGRPGSDHEVVDEQKYTLFLLKYAGQN